MREEWGPALFPMVPGHEIGGVVVDIGSNVTGFPVGSSVGVGCLIDSCRQCAMCRKGTEQYCQGDKGGGCFTYNSTFKYPHTAEFNGEGGEPNRTYGGYSKFIIVDKAFAISIPSNLDLAAATPLLCAGITTFSPLIHYDLRPSQRFAVIGLGGLGHMGVKFGKAFGCHTTVISRGTNKREMALGALRADAYIDSTDAEAMKAATGKFDFILNTVSAEHSIATYINLLDIDGKFIVVGVPPAALPLSYGPLIFGRKFIGGSLIGGIAETQQMMDFCGRHGITCEVETISADKIDEAFERTTKADVKFRFVIDTATI